MSKSLRILIWPDYLAPENVRRFEAEFNLTVQLDIIPSAVELVQKVVNGDTPTDVICPPDYAVRELDRDNRLLVLERVRLPNLKNIAPEFLLGRAHDPETQVSVPKDWGTTGFMYREDKIEERPTSWREFWRLAGKYSGKVTVLNSAAEVIGAALKMRGHSYNSMNGEELRQARSDLLALQPHVRFETNYRPLLISGQIWMALGWNGDAFVLKSNNIPVRYVVPLEGSQKWEDDWAIPTNARDVDMAYEFINFMLNADVALREARYTGYATPNQKAYEELEESVRNDPSVYPPTEIMEKLEWGLPEGREGQVSRDFSLLL
jgi:spermidine/putrescine-binding protein